MKIQTPLTLAAVLALTACSNMGSSPMATYSQSALPPTVQVPAASAVTLLPLTVQMAVVRLVKAVDVFKAGTELLAVTVPATPPSVITGAAPKDNVWATGR